MSEWDEERGDGEEVRSSGIGRLCFRSRLVVWRIRSRHNWSKVSRVFSRWFSICIRENDTHLGFLGRTALIDR